MYKEITLNPACMCEYHYYGLIKKDFGFEKGRYLILRVKEWAREAMEAVKESDIQPIKKTSIKHFLNKLQKGKYSEGIFLPSDRAKNFEGNYESWEQWWKLQMNNRKFTATVSEKCLGGSISFEDIIEDTDKWHVKPSIRVNKTPKNIVDSFISLLILSERVLIVDPYLSISSNKVLIELFSRLNQLPNIKQITVASAINTKSPDSAFKSQYEKMLPKGVIFKLIEFPDKYFHDRYVLTERGALQLGQGLKDELEKGAHSDKLAVHLVSCDDANSVHVSLKKALEERKAVVAFECNS